MSMALFSDIRRFFQKDELIGTWLNGADDGSGLNGIWGFGLTFHINGQGTAHYWGGEDIALDGDVPFSWQRLGPKSILLQHSSSLTKEKVEYIISDFSGAYRVRYHKLIQKGLPDEGFWNAPEALYRKK